MGRQEELAHSRALANRNSISNHRPRERRKERRYAVSETSVKASVLGDQRAAMDCRIIDISRSGMRIAVPQLVPQHAQISVAWGNDCFVGTSCYSFEQGGEHVLGLRLVASTCRELGFLSDVKYQCNEFRQLVGNRSWIWIQRSKNFRLTSRGTARAKTV
jgi:hypothetical protein